jgi:hypothetical protein
LKIYKLQYINNLTKPLVRNKNENSMIDIIIDGNISTQTVDIIRQRLNAQLKDKRITIHSKPSLSLELDADTIISITSAITAIIALTVNLFDRYKKDRWSSERINEFIRNEALKKDIIDYELLSIENYSGMLKNPNESCKIRILDKKSGIRYMLLIYKDKDVITFKIN